jgi:hypothetical protein
MIQIGGKSTMPFSDKKTYPQYFSKNNRVGGGIEVGVSEYNLGDIVLSLSQSLAY